jgi:hypothetical protein
VAGCGLVWPAANGNSLGTPGRGRGMARAQPLRRVGGMGHGATAVLRGRLRLAMVVAREARG